MNGVEITIIAFGGGVTGWITHALAQRWRQHWRKTREAPVLSEAALPQVPSPIWCPPVTPVSIPSGSSVVPPDVNSAGRVILHLASLGWLSPHEVARFGYTQGGMIQALDIRQGTLAKVLSRLVAARVIEVDLRHVQGQARRLKVYRLTNMGEAVARNLRTRHVTRIVPDTPGTEGYGPKSNARETHPSGNLSNR